MSEKTERKPLGLVWVYCDDPVLCLGFETILEAEADVCCGRELPAGASPSFAICPYGGDVASELRRLGALVPDVPALAFGLHVDPKLARIAIRAGARGFIHAGMRTAQVVRALSLASNGKVVVPGELLKGLTAEKAPADLVALTCH